MSSTNSKQGKRCVETQAHNGKRQNIVIAIVCIAIILLGIFLGCHMVMTHMQGKSVFQKIVRDGYTGTQEQWLASIVGEEAKEGSTRTAYELACDYGYKQSESVWLETLTGCKPDALNMTPYSLACENGFTGTLAQWLTTIADDPEILGQAGEQEEKTEYELACEYGYTGTFIEWLVSVTHDRVFN